METYITKINLIEKLLTEDKLQLAGEKLQELKNTIIYDIVVKNCGHKSYKKEQLKSARELLQYSKKVNEHRVLFHKIYKLDDTYQLCDGFTGIVLKNMIDGLELNTEKGEYFDCRKIINACNPTSREYGEVKIDMLDLEQKALAFKNMKVYTPPVEHQIHINNLYFNPLYLLRAIKILGTENVKAYAHCTYEKEPIYLTSDLGEAVVLPLMPPRN